MHTQPFCQPEERDTGSLPENGSRQGGEFGIAPQIAGGAVAVALLRIFQVVWGPPPPAELCLPTLQV